MARGFDEDELASLLARCRNGESRAWRDLVDRFQAFVYSIPKRMGLSDEDSADVFQATFIALHRSLDRIESAAALPKWIGVTAGREALRLRRIGAKVQVSATQDVERSLEELVASEEASAEEAAIQACDARIVRGAVAALGDRCAKLLSALYLDGERPYQEISTQLGIPMGAIGPTRARCLEKLRKALADGGFFA